MNVENHGQLFDAIRAGKAIRYTGRSHAWLEPGDTFQLNEEMQIENPVNKTHPCILIGKPEVWEIIPRIPSPEKTAVFIRGSGLHTVVKLHSNNGAVKVAMERMNNFILLRWLAFPEVWVDRQDFFSFGRMQFTAKMTVSYPTFIEKVESGNIRVLCPGLYNEPSRWRALEFFTTTLEDDYSALHEALLALVGHADKVLSVVGPKLVVDHPH